MNFFLEQIVFLTNHKHYNFVLTLMCIIPTHVTAHDFSNLSPTVQVSTFLGILCMLQHMRFQRFSWRRKSFPTFCACFAAPSENSEQHETCFHSPSVPSVAFLALSLILASPTLPPAGRESWDQPTPASAYPRAPPTLSSPSWSTTCPSSHQLPLLPLLVTLA